MNTPVESNTPQPEANQTPGANASYEAPCIESILSGEDIEREVQYAGVAGSIPVPL